VPHIAILGTALTTHAARTVGLFVGGLDVSKDPVSGRYGVAYDTMTVQEQGPGGVSSMSFTIDDPNRLVTVAEGMEVRLQIPPDSGFPVFLGYVQAFSVSPAFGDLGRSIAVEAVGIEAVLDWALLPADCVVPAGMESYAAIQKVVAACIGVGELNATAFGGAVLHGSDRTNPLETPAAGLLLTLGMTITAGTSMREAIRQVFANLQNNLGTYMPKCTIDFTRGLRVWGQNFSPYATLLIQDVIGSGLIFAEGLQHQVDVSGVARGVFVKGTGFSAAVFDGSGIPGPISYVTDDTLDTAAKVQAAAIQYLNDFSPGIRGSLSLQDRTDLHNADYWTGSRIDIIDARVPLDTTAPFADIYFIGGITKTFLGNSTGATSAETWVIDYGGMAPSLVNALRRLTRTQRN
jgi:hypothetical protein